jgi:LPXTG-motif cell wall-anchored protein
MIVGLGTAGVASAQATSTDYTPAVDSEVLGTQQAAAVTSAGTLPYTGSDSSLPLAEIGAGLLAAGGLTVVMVRRHQAQAEA